MTEPPSLEFFDLQDAVAGRYSLDREIGRGGMGIVFLARDVALDRPVAIKLFPPDLANVPSLRARFLREARTAARLAHPHIVPIHAVEEIGDVVFVVMTYVEGETVTERVARTGSLSVTDTVRVLQEVSWALGHAHGQGVVHRDVKADNILLERSSGRAVVTDFGIATLDDEPDEVAGTPAYMSPEQATGDAVDGRSDLYSLGVVGYLALAGRLPFQGDSAAALVGQHIQTAPARLTSVAPGVPPRLAAIVERCREKSPQSRYPWAEDLSDALGAVLETRRDLPVALRLFLGESKRNQHRPFRVLGLAYIFLWVTGNFALGGSVLGWMFAGGFGLLFLGIPVGRLLLRCRRVLWSGLDRTDVLRALQRDLEARREELTFLHGARHQERTRGMRLMSYSGLSIGAIGAVLGGLGFASAGSLGIAGMVTIAGAAAGLLADRRSDSLAKRRVKFWTGRVGRWVFEVAGIGAKRPAVIALTGRPTEVAVGLAVVGLYQSLPKEARIELPDLPAVVRDLETEARRMRDKVTEYTTLLAHAGATADDAANGSLDDRRAEAITKLQLARDSAQTRMQEAVAALETLRTDLLRLRAGQADLTSVTTRLGRARDLVGAVERLADAHEELNRDLPPGSLTDPTRTLREE